MEQKVYEALVVVSSVTKIRVLAENMTQAAEKVEGCDLSVIEEAAYTAGGVITYAGVTEIKISSNQNKDNLTIK